MQPGAPPQPWGGECLEAVPIRLGERHGPTLETSLMLQGRARLWSAHYREKLKRHFEGGIEVGDSEQLVRAAALASPAPGHGG